MSEPTRDAYQREVDKTHSVAALDGIEYGTIGWAGNPDVMQVGTGGDDGTEEGSTLFRVTVYRGRLPGGNPKPGLAEGMEILADFLGPLFFAFPAGKRVAICWPNKTPGAPALILGTVGASPGQQFRDKRLVLDAGPDADVYIKGRSVTLMDHQGDAPGTFGCWLALGPIGNSGVSTIYATDGTGGTLSIGDNAAGLAVGDGSGGVGAVFQLGNKNAPQPGVGWMYNGTEASMFQLDDSGVWKFGGQKCTLGFGNINLGAGALLAQTVLYGPVGVSGIASTSVFVQA